MRFESEKVGKRYDQAEVRDNVYVHCSFLLLQGLDYAEKRVFEEGLHYCEQADPDHVICHLGHFF